MPELAYLLLAAVVLFFVVVLWVFPGDVGQRSLASGSSAPVSQPVAIPIPVAMSVAAPVRAVPASPPVAGPESAGSPPPPAREVPPAPPPSLGAQLPGMEMPAPGGNRRRGLLIAAGACVAIAVVIAARR